MQNDPNEDEALLPRLTYQSAWIKANIALELTLLEAARYHPLWLSLAEK
jgi:hypothetical protein